MVGRRVVGALLVACLVLSTVTGLAGAFSDATADSTVNIVVTFESKGARDPAVITNHGGTVTGGRSIDIVPVLFARVPEDAIHGLREHPNVTAVERDVEMDTIGETIPWGVAHVNATDAQESVDNGSEANVTVAVIDTGIDYDHEDLDGNVVWGVNTVGAGSIERGVKAADDDNGHGTHVAGILAAEANGLGVLGVAPNTELYSIKALGETGTGTMSDVVQGLDAAVKGPDGTMGTGDDPHVISMSLGTPEDSEILQNAIQEAAEEAVLVAAAGNTGDGNASTNDVQYPAKYDAVIAVAAADQSNGVPTWSSDGAEVEIAAPGTDIYSTYFRGQYTTLSGTSMAAPHVSGVVALLVAHDLEDGTRDLDTSAVRTRLQETALDIGPAGRDDFSGYGLIQAEAVIEKTVVNLTLSINRSTVRVGSPVTFTVRRGDTGDTVAATVDIEGTTLLTGEDGNVTYTFNETGTVTVTASKADTADAAFRDATLEAVVERERVGLQVEASRRSATVGDAITFTVRRADTGEPVAATLTIDGTTITTDTDGSATHTFDRTGTFTVRATKEASSTTEFLEATLEVVINKTTVGLTLSASTRTPAVGEEVRFTVRRADTGEPVAANLSIDGTVIQTGADGNATYVFDEPGAVAVTARKAETERTIYSEASLQLTVGESEPSLAEQYDTNDNDRLDLRELQQAIADWVGDEIGLRDLQRLIDLWANDTRL